MDDIVKSKEMLFEIVDFFEKYKDVFTNSGFNDGYSEQYNFENLIYVKVFATGEFSRNFKYGVLYNGDNELATISVDGSSSLDNEFIDEINEVINVYNEISESMEVFKKSMPLIEKETFLSEKIKEKKEKIKSYLIDDIVQSKEMLFEIVNFFETYKDELTHSIFNEGFSEKYNFENLNYVKIFAMGEFSRNFKHAVLYNGDNKLATISRDCSSSLDNQFVDEINEVIKVYNEISDSMKVFKISMPLIEKETFLSKKMKEKQEKIKSYLIDDIVKSKEMLFEIVDFFEKYKDVFTNSGFNEGYSEKYNFENLNYVKVFATGEFSRNFKHGVLYNGDNELATISVDGSSSLDNEFLDEINEVIKVYNEISESIEVFKNSMPLIEKETFLSEKIKDKKTKIKTKNS